MDREPWGEMDYRVNNLKFIIDQFINGNLWMMIWNRINWDWETR